MTRYGILFQVEVLHDFHINLGSIVHEALSDERRAAVRRAYLAGSFLEVAPTEGSGRTLAGHQLLFKNNPDGFKVGVKLDPAAADERPAVSPGQDFRVRFALRVREPRFFNFTMLAEAAPSFYYFSNLSSNVADGRSFLSLPVPAHDATRVYEAGEVFVDSSGPTTNLFRAVRDTGPSSTPIAADWERIPADTYDPSASYLSGAIVLNANGLFRALVDNPGTDLQDTADWQPLGSLANQYVTAADSLVAKPSVFSLDLSGAAVPTASVHLFRRGGSTAVWERSFVAAEGVLERVQLDLRELAPAPYRLEVRDGSGVAIPGAGFEMYLDTEAVRGGWLGVVEIGLGGGEAALLDAAGALRSPRYQLRWLNRATRWRYIFPADQATGPGAEVAPENGDQRVLVSAGPLPLTRFGAGIRLQSDESTTPTSEEVLLPQPETRFIRRREEQWYSDVHVSNVQI